MKYLKFLLNGVFFGIILSKSEAISWYRIYEMFKFQSFHMYGIIGSAIITGIIIFRFIKYFNLKNIKNEEIEFIPKKNGKYRNLLGGIIFGLGWALAGACPAPFFVLLGQGYLPIIIVIISASFGSFVYHSVKHKIPH